MAMWDHAQPGFALPCFPTLSLPPSNFALSFLLLLLRPALCPHPLALFPVKHLSHQRAAQFPLAVTAFPERFPSFLAIAGPVEGSVCLPASVCHRRFSDVIAVSLPANVRRGIPTFFGSIFLLHTWNVSGLGFWDRSEFLPDLYFSRCTTEGVFCSEVLGWVEEQLVRGRRQSSRLYNLRNWVLCMFFCGFYKCYFL